MIRVNVLFFSVLIGASGCTMTSTRQGLAEKVNLNVEQIRYSANADYEYCDAIACQARTIKSMSFAETMGLQATSSVKPEVSHAKVVAKKNVIKKKRKGVKKKKTNTVKYVCVPQIKR